MFLFSLVFGPPTVSYAEIPEFTLIQIPDCTGSSPQLDQNGDSVWGGSDVLHHEYGDMIITELTTGSNGSYLPQMSKDEYVVWAEHDGTDREIFRWDGLSAPIQITDNAVDDWYPEVNNSGAVAWNSGSDANTWEIFYGDGSLSPGRPPGLTLQDGPDTSSQKCSPQKHEQCNQQTAGILILWRRSVAHRSFGIAPRAATATATDDILRKHHVRHRHGCGGRRNRR